ncbi:MAG: response regulator transcription factor, partial [Saprospiraceae bacterium]|nr:response regulator transcription factor [Saprospiraceae bacterium]
GLIRQMLQSGASGYLLKNTNKDEFVTAIKTVADGGTHLSRIASESLINSIMNRPESGHIPQLTKREEEILQLISREHSTHEIAELLYLSPNTIEYHRKNLFNKLNVKNVAGLIRVAMERGLLG